MSKSLKKKAPTLKWVRGYIKLKFLTGLAVATWNEMKKFATRNWSEHQKGYVVPLRTSSGYFQTRQLGLIIPCDSIFLHRMAAQRGKTQLVLYFCFLDMKGP